MTLEIRAGSNFPALIYEKDPDTIEGVIARLRAIDQYLGPADGVKWWNLLYLITTERVYAQGTAGWEDPEWLKRLDINFAARYFEVLRQYYADKPVTTHAWRALLLGRSRKGVDRIQFAISGMNAHIDYDLARALAKTNIELGITPSKDSAQYRDYRKVNELFKVLIPQTLAYLDTGIWGVAANWTGPLGKLVALVQIETARDVAWDLSGLLLRMKPRTKRAFDAVQNRVIGSVSSFVLLPMDPTQTRLGMKVLNGKLVRGILSAPLKVAQVLLRLLGADSDSRD